MGHLNSKNEFVTHTNLPAKEIDPLGHRPSVDVRPTDPSLLGNADLIKTITQQVSELAKKEVELARAEAEVDLQAELELTKGLAIAGVCGLIAINLFIMSLVLLFAPQHAWLACLILSLVLVGVGAFCAHRGWKSRAKEPMNNTMDSLKEMAALIKERMR